MTKVINPLELYVNGYKVYPSSVTEPPLETLLGYTPDRMVEWKHVAQEILENNYLNVTNVDGLDINTEYYMPTLTAEQIAASEDKWMLRRCLGCEMPIDLSIGIGGGMEYDPAIQDYYECWGFYDALWKEVTFTGQMQEVDFNGTDYVKYEYSMLLLRNYLLETITGLNIKGNCIGKNTDNTCLRGWYYLFDHCEKLHSFVNCTWPTDWHGDEYQYMFNACNSLPDNQFPTINLTGGDTEPDHATPNLVNCEYMFSGCSLLEHSPLTSASWQYIYNATRMFEGSGITELEIPANTPSSINLDCIVNNHAIEKIIIRASGITECLLNNWWDHYWDETWRNNFDGIYVPDAEVNDWTYAQAGEQDEDWQQWIATKVYGLSQLVE